MGQNVGLALLRRREPAPAGAFRMGWYPLPSLVALAGWLFIFGNSRAAWLLGMAFLASGWLAYRIHVRFIRLGSGSPQTLASP